MWQFVLKEIAALLTMELIVGKRNGVERAAEERARRVDDPTPDGRGSVDGKPVDA